jgi:GWxTD domain-containing protein
MSEYYERIDYAINNFSTITGILGIQTDRGSTYVRFGKPTSIERSTNGEGKVSESWFYSKLNKYFYFVDERGTGEFTLKDKL